MSDVESTTLLCDDILPSERTISWGADGWYYVKDENGDVIASGPVVDWRKRESVYTFRCNSATTEIFEFSIAKKSDDIPEAESDEFVKGF